MNLKPYYKSAYRPDLFWVLIAALNILLAVILVYFIFLHPATPAYDMAVQAVNNLNNHSDYNLQIYEQAGNRSLSFRGTVSGKNLSGTIPEHNVVVYCKGDRLYIRNTDYSPWENSEDAEIEKLKAFLLTPYEMFGLIQNYITDVKLGPEKGRDDNIYKTIYWTIDSPEFWSALFPAVNTSYINDGTISAEISASSFDIKKVNISIVLVTPENEKQVIRRTLTLSPANQKV